VDGEIHSLKENKDYDKRREKILVINGYNVLRIANLEIETNIESSVNRIQSYIKTLLLPSNGELLRK
jgi:very-short-patch-repair endonuclease